MQHTSTPWHEVRQSALHGRGVFASRFIPAGTYILEYEGARISGEEADNMAPSDPNDPFHTFFFSLSDGNIIDGGDGGNDSRFINHSCEPNCEGHENHDGTRVYIVTLRDIDANEELLYDYALTIDDTLTETLQQQYACFCGSDSCRGTMLALPEKKSARKKDRIKKLRKQQKKLLKRMDRLEDKLDRLLYLLDNDPTH